MFTLIALLFSCTQPPEISGIDPTTGPPGTPITIHGAHLVEGTTVRLGGVELGELVVTPPGTVTGTVPTELTAGQADLVLTTPAGRVSRSAAFSVTVPPPTNPCSGQERRFTHIPPTADVVKIDRHLGKDEVQRTQIKTREIEAIEVERTQQGSATCAAIWLRTGSGRVLFDAQKDVDLRVQAQEIANGLHKPLEVGEHVDLPVDGDAAGG